MAYGRDTVAILGLGLIGGSLARALRVSGFSKHFIGYGYRERSLQKGQELGVIDEFSLDLDEVLARADIAVICAPTLVAADMLADWDNVLGKFVKVMPRDYKRALETLEAERNEAASVAAE